MRRKSKIHSDGGINKEKQREAEDKRTIGPSEAAASSHHFVVYIMKPRLLLMLGDIHLSDWLRRRGCEAADWLMLCEWT